MKNFWSLMILLSLTLAACTGDQANDTDANDNTTTTNSNLSKYEEELQANAVPASKRMEEVPASTEMTDETNVPAPVWVAEIIKKDPDETRVLRCNMKGTDYYLINTCVNCPTQLTEVFDINRKKMCYIGGPEQKITCTEIFPDGMNQKCQPIMLNSNPN